jgi:hypothetical protein
MSSKSITPLSLIDLSGSSTNSSISSSRSHFIKLIEEENGKESGGPDKESGGPVKESGGPVHTSSTTKRQHQQVDNSDKMVTLFQEMNDTFKSSVKANSNADASNYVNDCIKKYYQNVLSSSQRMKIKCHLAEFPFKAKLLPALEKDEINELFSEILGERIECSITEI